jgi:hypothetical protein
LLFAIGTDYSGGGGRRSPAAWVISSVGRLHYWEAGLTFFIGDRAMAQ